MAMLRPVKAAARVEYRPWRPPWWGIVVVGAGVAGVVLGLLVSAFSPRGALSGYEYHLWKWQADTFLGTVFSVAGIGPDPGETAGDESLLAYFRLTSQIRAATDTGEPDLALVETLENERATYENDVERTIEQRIDEAIKGAGLQRTLPLFSGVRLTWPPVNFELTSPPRLLVRSPRDRIERAGDTLLKNDLSLGDIQRIEERTDDEKTVSLVISIGGLAAYPAIVRDDRTYGSILETAAHEWVHHYLAFYPLGRQWGKGGDAETLNETTADLAGREIAKLVNERYPVEFADGEDGRAPARPADNIDFNAEMRELRLQVDGLLAEGKVAEAEAAMEAKRLYLNNNGITIRKINQAYFAFYGTYADSPQSSSPIGPKVNRVWELTGEVGAFLEAMRDVTSVADLDRVIAVLERGARDD
ncbi:MAG TPA: hypothetical protein PKD75_01715 [Tepidiformaceae bacterium]|nr:hypothetical protein [Tepidiformaceae bacterium]